MCGRTLLARRGRWLVVPLFIPFLRFNVRVCGLSILYLYSGLFVACAPVDCGGLAVLV